MELDEQRMECVTNWHPAWLSICLYDSANTLASVCVCVPCPLIIASSYFINLLVFSNLFLIESLVLIFVAHILGTNLYTPSECISSISHLTCSMPANHLALSHSLLKLAGLFLLSFCSWNLQIELNFSALCRGCYWTMWHSFFAYGLHKNGMNQLFANSFVYTNTSLICKKNNILKLSNTWPQGWICFTHIREEFTKLYFVIFYLWETKHWECHSLISSVCI